jgi:hypothetical protein
MPIRRTLGRFAAMPSATLNARRGSDIPLGTAAGLKGLYLEPLLPFILYLAERWQAGGESETLSSV